MTIENTSLQKLLIYTLVENGFDGQWKEKDGKIIFSSVDSSTVPLNEYILKNGFLDYNLALRLMLNLGAQLVELYKYNYGVLYFSSSDITVVNGNTFLLTNTSNIIPMNDDEVLVLNTPIKIINPENLKTIETKIHKNGKYPKIFNIVVSKKIATILELDEDNPYVEIFEIKKNKTFIAKESNTFEEEKKVAEEAPVDEVKMTNLSKNEIEDNKNIVEKNFILVVSDFYYYESAENLRSELVEKVKKNNFSVRKINDNKYRLFAGPFKDFNSLKFIYISLNNLGFENLNIHRE